MPAHVLYCTRNASQLRDDLYIITYNSQTGALYVAQEGGKFVCGAFKYLQNVSTATPVCHNDSGIPLAICPVASCHLVQVAAHPPYHVSPSCRNAYSKGRPPQVRRFHNPFSHSAFVQHYAHIVGSWHPAALRWLPNRVLWLTFIYRSLELLPARREPSVP